MIQGSRHLIAPELLPALDLIPPLDLDDATLARMRAPFFGERRAAVQLTQEQSAVRMEVRYVPGPNGAPDVRILVYTPPGTSLDRPAICHMHGGGMILGVPEINDAGNRDMALAHDCVIISTDYRLAPEARWFESYEDNYAVLAWMHHQSAALGIDPKRIALVGESAGGGHAAALALLARDRGQYPVCFQLLDCPMLDDRTGTSAGPERHPYTGEFVWTPAFNRFGWRALLGQEPGIADVPTDAVPARATDLTRLPPTFIALGALDLFLEESLDYARRLTRAGVSVELHVIPGAFHAFYAAGPAAPQVKALLQYRHDALARAFAS